MRDLKRLLTFRHSNFFSLFKTPVPSLGNLTAQLTQREFSIFCLTYGFLINFSSQVLCMASKLLEHPILILQFLDAKNKSQENQNNYFPKMQRKCDSSFYICNEKIDIVQNYTYLGSCISSTGNFTLSLDHLRQKALHALFSLRRNIDFKSLKPSLACKIFDSMISPILTYDSEIWGTFVKSDFKSWDNSPIEKAHLQFCERY